MRMRNSPSTLRPIQIDDHSPAPAAFPSGAGHNLQRYLTVNALGCDRIIHSEGQLQRFATFLQCSVNRAPCACAFGVALVCLASLPFRVYFALENPNKRVNAMYIQRISHKAR